MDTNTRKHVADQVRAARKAHRWTQPELAEHAGVSVGTVSNTERAISWPQPSHLRAILRALDITLDEPGEPADQRDENSTALAWFLSLHDDVRTALYMVGLYLERFEGEERDARIREVVSAIVDRRL